MENRVQPANGRADPLPFAIREELIWQTQMVLKSALSRMDSREMLQYLAEQYEDGPHALRIEELMAQVRKGFDSTTVTEHAVCSSFLLALHFALLNAAHDGIFQPQSNPTHAVLASHLLLHQKQTWDLAARLAEGDPEYPKIVEQLNNLRQRFNGRGTL